VFYREHAARTYNSLVYAASIIIPELPFALITAVLYTYAYKTRTLLAPQ
jgi:hypothetical protein